MESRAAAGEEGIAVEASRSVRKRQGIIEAATEAFLRSGYLGTSMDEIAALAGVSKQTVYKQFADKERLFTEIVLGTIDQVGEPFWGGIDVLENTENLETDLRKVAGQLITIVSDPQLLQLRRLVIGEAGRFPELGRSYYERGPGRSAERLASQFQVLGERGLLELDDPQLAAQHFNWLVLSIPLNQAMFSVDLDFSPAELDRYADEAVRIFLAAYRGSS
jgi:TetR/AcrR family transcriptional regulator, mexJK operon transcriptional repressor